MKAVSFSALITPNFVEAPLKNPFQAQNSSSAAFDNLSQTVIEGDFVRLRPLRHADAECTLSWRMSHRSSLLNSGAQTVQEQAAFIDSRPRSEINFVIEILSTGIPVGMLSLIAIDLVNRRAESARFLIGEPELVKGIPVAVEAMKLLYEFAFHGLGLSRIYGTVASDNHLMIKWQKFLGMVEEGRLRNHYLIQGRFQDAVCLGILSEEYEKTALPRMKGLMRVGTTRSAESSS